MRFTDNASIATDTMVNDDILAGTDVSTGNDRKFTLANLAAWLLNKFTGLSLAGSNQTVKAALDSLNSNLNGVKIVTSSIAANSSKTFTVESNSRILAVVLTNQAAAIGAFGISVTSGGSVYRQKIGGGESIDIPTTAANSVTFTHSASSGGGIIAFICFSGSASEA